MPIPRVVAPKARDREYDALVAKHIEEERRRKAAERELEKYKAAERNRAPINLELANGLNRLAKQ